MKKKHTSWAQRLSVIWLCCVLLAPMAAPVWAADSATPGSQSAAGEDAPAQSESTPAETPAEEEASPVRPAGTDTGWLYEPTGFTPQAAGICLVNEDSGLVVYEKNADTPLVTASLVKLMSAILTMEKATNLDTETITAPDWVFDELYGKNASHADIRKGETLSLRELLYAALLPSGNEAAMMLGDYVSGGYLPNFLFMMNQKAEALGCTGTVFADASGLAEDNVTTARDMCLIMRAFMTHPELVEIASAPTYEVAAHEKHAEPYLIHSTNRLLVETSPYYKTFPAVAGNVLAGKTGSLGEWQNFAVAAERDGNRYICVVLNSPHEADAVGATLQPPQARPAVYEAAQLLNWAFENLSVRPALDTTQPITEVPVRYCSDYDSVKLLPSTDMSALLPVDATDKDIQRDFDVPDSIEAPVKEGQHIGSVTLSLEGQVIGTAELTAAHGAERNNALYMVRRVQEFIVSSAFRILLAIAVLAVGLYIGAVLLVNYLHRQKKTGNNHK